MTTQPPDSGQANHTGQLSRRFFVTASAAAGVAMARGTAGAAIVRTDFHLPPYGNGTLQPGIHPRMVPNVNGLMVHILEAGFGNPGGRWCCCSTAFRNSP